jgi:DNA-binding HxlR family transcriptional regulator
MLLYALSNGRNRFGELQAAVGGVNPRTLSARLDALEQDGVISKTTYSEMPPRVEYVLTEKGQDLLPILESMIVWGQKHNN